MYLCSKHTLLFLCYSRHDPYSPHHSQGTPPPHSTPPDLHWSHSHRCLLHRLHPSPSTNCHTRSQCSRGHTHKSRSRYYPEHIDSDRHSQRIPTHSHSMVYCWQGPQSSLHGYCSCRGSWPGGSLYLSSQHHSYTHLWQCYRCHAPCSLHCTPDIPVSHKDLLCNH